MSANRIVVSAVVIRDPRGRVLTVRKAGTSRFMLVGGKPEAGESPADAAVREAAEEVGLVLDLRRLELLGEFVTAAANEPGYELVSTCYTHPWAGEPAPAGEIAEMRWLDLDLALPDDLAPLLTDAVIPLLRPGR